MSQCVPDWDLDDSGKTHPTPSRLSLRSPSFNPTTPDVPMSNYEVAELTWENGQLALHGLCPPRPPAKPHPPSASHPKYAWVDKPRAANAASPAGAGAGAGTGTLECIVNQATALPRPKLPFDSAAAVGGLAPWFDPSRGSSAPASATMTMDALVPCAGAADDGTTAHFVDSAPGGGDGGGGVVGCSTRVGSCSGAAAGPAREEDALAGRKRAKVARAAAAEWSGMDQSVSGSATFGRDSQPVTLDTGEMDIGAGMTSTSLGSPENTSPGKDCARATAAAEDHDSVCHSRPPREGGDDGDGRKRSGKSSASTKRSRAAAIHNQSERKRRDKINQRMKTLQKLVPNSSKTDKASVLDEVIEYLKQLQAQVQMVNKMNMQSMMMPMVMQQQLQMSIMGQMGLGMVGMGMPGMGMMDMNALCRSNLASIPPVLHPAAAAAAAAAATFMPTSSWDGDRVPATAPMVMPDPLSPFLASQSQPMTLDAYSRMAAMFQQMHQPPASSSKN